MKKFFKALAVILAMTLVIGAVPVSAADTALSLKKTSKTLFVGGCKGAKASTGKKAPYYSYTTLKKLVKNFDADTMKVRATSSDTSIVKTSTTRMTAVSTGTATVTIKVYKNKVSSKNLIFTDTVKVTVKKNAAPEDLTYSGIKDGKTYEVGEKIKVSVPRGTDTDYRRLTAKTSNITLSSAGTRKWYVTFTKAGAFELLAESYQSSTYNKATQSVTIKGTVVDAEPEEVEPTGEIKQLTAKSFQIKGSVVTSDLEASDITMEYVSGTYTFPYYKSFDLKVSKDVATVDFFANFEAGTTYNVTVDGVKMSFTAAGSDVKDVTSMEIVTKKVLAGASQNIDFKFYAGDVDVTDYVGSVLKVNTTLKQINGDSYSLVDSSAKTILFFEKDKATTVEATCALYYTEDWTPKTISCTGSIVSYEEPAPQVVNRLYTIAANDAVYMTKSDKLSTEFAIGDDISFEALYIYSDGSVKTMAAEGITSVSSSNPYTALITGNSLSGGYTLTGIQQGTTDILLYKGTAIIDKVTISVIPARKATSVTAKLDKTSLNVNAAAGDVIKLTATVYDQYGSPMTGAPLTVEQKEITQTLTGTVSFGTFSGGTLYIYGTDVYLNPGHTNNGIALSVKSGSLVSNTLSFTVDDIAYDPAKSSDYKLSINVEGPTIIDTSLDMGAQTFESTYVSPVYTKGDYFVYEPSVIYLNSRPTSALKASDLGVPVGETVLCATVTFEDKCIGTGSNIMHTGYGIDINPVTYGSKLKPGKYIITIYRIVAGASGSPVTPVGNTVLTVISSDPDITYKKIADSANSSMSDPWKTKLTKLMEFYIDGVKIDNALISEIIVDSPVYGQGKTVITNMRLVLDNSVYGPFEVNVPIPGGSEVLSINY